MIISEGLTSPSLSSTSWTYMTILHPQDVKVIATTPTWPNRRKFLRQTAPWHCPFSIRLSGT